jgi:hypothetical protein
LSRCAGGEKARTVVRFELGTHHHFRDYGGLGVIEFLDLDGANCTRHRRLSEISYFTKKNCGTTSVS